MEVGFTREDELLALNRFRCHQQVLCLSDVLNAGGRSIDQKYRARRSPTESWSHFIFPTKNPPARHIQLWHQALDAIAPRGWVMQRLRNYRELGHKHMEWFFEEGANEVLYKKGVVMDIYCPLLLANYERRQNHWSLTFRNEPQSDRGIYCSVKVIDPSTISISATATPPPKKAVPANFWEALANWGHSWMWEQLHIVGNDHWIQDSIQAEECIGRLIGSLVEKTPEAGSYRGELLGLMAIHLILLAVNKCRQDLGGLIHIFTDCLGAIKKV
jgi:hypothetical protein